MTGYEILESDGITIPAGGWTIQSVDSNTMAIIVPAALANTGATYTFKLKVMAGWTSLSTLEDISITVPSTAATTVGPTVAGNILETNSYINGLSDT